MSEFILGTRSKTIDLVEPRIEQIDIQDIAHALAGINRYLGHTRLSVAQHSVYTAMLMQRLSNDTPELMLAALLHDAHEAYLGDWARPVMQMLAASHPQAAEFLDRRRDRLQMLIEKKYLGRHYGKVTYRMPEVKKVDEMALQAELVYLFQARNQSQLDQELHLQMASDLVEVTHQCLAPWTPGIAEDQFIRLYYDLTYNRTQQAQKENA